LFYQFDSNYSSFEINSYLPKGIVSFLILLAVINQFWIDKHLVELEKRNQQFIEHEKRLIQVELSNLKQQFQPHFLFNSLNSISALVGSEPKEARRMILLLSDFLRISIRNKEQDFESLKNELEFLNLYLEIEKVRFGHRLNLNLVFPENADGIQIPSQMLQPLVENAIKFGLYGNIGELTIELKIEIIEEKLILKIQNPYDLDFESKKNGVGFGLKSIEQKLLLLYRRNDLLQIEKQDGVFRVKIEIPRPKDVKEK
jgi:LytS/YehU family sensor histidine kinase